MKHRFSACSFLLAGALALAGCCAFSPAAAQSVSGRLTTSVYLYERSDTAGVSSNQSRLYQGLQLSVVKNRFALQAYGQVDGDVSTSLAGDGRLRMFQLYLEWQDPNRKSYFRLGRQAVFAGVGSGTFDGVQARVRPLSWLGLKAFAGGLVPQNQRFSIIDSLDRNYAVGGQLQFTPSPSLRGSLSYSRKRQLRGSYTTTRSDSIGNLFTREIEASDRAFELASADLGWRLSPGTDLYGRADLDVYSMQPSRAEASIRSDALSRVTLTGAWTFRSPRMPWNSIFSVFNVKDNHELEGGLSYRVKPELRLYTEAAGIFYSGEDSFRSTIGIDAGYAGLSLVHRAGYGGVLDGVNASFYRPLLKSRVAPSLQVSWASYRPDPGLGKRIPLLSGAAGVLVQATRQVSVDSQVQVLHNRYYDKDVRFVFRLQYWLFSRMGGPGR